MGKKSKHKGYRGKGGGQAIVLASSGELEAHGGGGGGGRLKDGASDVLWEGAAIIGARKMAVAHIDKMVEKAKPAERDTVRREESRSLGLKMAAGGFLGLRTFAKGDLANTGSRASFVNGCILVADSL